MQAEVVDSFNVKGRVAIEYGATGVVAIVRTGGLAEPPEPGSVLLVVRPDGWMTRVRAGEVKPQDANGFGVFMHALTKQDVPVGSQVRWGRDFWPDSSETGTAAASLVRA